MPQSSKAETKRFLVANAGQLLTLTGPDAPRAGKLQGGLGILPDGAVLIEGDEIVGLGPYGVLKGLPQSRGAELIDAGGRVVLPGLVDSHSHPVFAGSRLDDFAMRVRGVGWAEIAQRGGGILSSVAHVRAATEDQLVEGLRGWAARFLECGTTTLEAKSGYGLSQDAELKMLRAIGRVSQEGPLELVATFLGAHAVPPEFEKPSRYVEHLVRDVLPAVAEAGLAEFADVFCDQGYFSPDEAESILAAAEAAGLKTKIHAEQLGRTGGSEVAARVRSVSADHLDHAGPKEIERLRGAGTIASLIPACNLFLAKPMPPARALISAGVPVALATDFNPGSCPCWNLQFVVALACTQMRMTPEEAIVAATINGAHALGRSKRLGSLEVGKQADVLILDVKDYRELAYYFGGHQTHRVIKRGRIVYGPGAAGAAAAAPGRSEAAR